MEVLLPAQHRAGAEADVRALLLYPPVLPYGYTLHHRFQRLWEVGQYLRRRYPGTKILDAGLLNYLKGQVVAEMAKRYDVVAIYAEPQMLPDLRDLVERCRSMNPKTRIIVYGPATVCFPSQVLSIPIDAMGFRGDIEAQLRQFLDLISGRANVSSNIYTRADGEWLSPTGRPETVSPDEWGFPPLGEMPIDDITRIYQMKNQQLTVAVTASRGCPYRCTFCATPRFEGLPDRRRSPEVLIDYIADHRNYHMWQFYSPTFTLNRKWCLEFLEQLRTRDLGIRWRCTTRVDRLDEDLVREMALSGCCMVGLGVETLGPALDRIRKDITKEEVSSAVSLLTKHGIEPKAYVMLGLPGQSLDDVRATFDFLNNMGVRIRPSLYSPQGEADELSDTLVSRQDTATVGQLDRRSFYLGGENYGEFLRLTFERYASQSSDTEPRP